MINVIVNNIISKILISYVNIFQEKIQIFIISIFLNILFKLVMI